ncbi:hypothetical protein QJS10_CPB19g01983 [Acorus calamus]|uniref:Uncharacterized protein n=1 Tax=Acorus calamus TaxID=4465 RepID=A0AAV9CG97_ACOCL|nr:hypothetical protein QJS10_CPB19g01983 [Acorus calamus]
MALISVISDNESYPHSDETYAEELQFQEVMMHVSSTTTTTPTLNCMICMVDKSLEEMFDNEICDHLFCFDCIIQHIDSKVQENISSIRCPNPECHAVLMSEACKEFLPSEVFERWNKALCETAIIGERRMYCPYRDCNAFMVYDSGRRS